MAIFVAHERALLDVFITYYRAYKAKYQQFLQNGCKTDLDIKEKIGELVREKRSSKGWTQEKLSSEAGINNRFLQKIEAGDRLPSLVTIFKLSKALNIVPEKLIGPAWKEWIRTIE